MKEAQEQQQFPPPPIIQDPAGVPTPPPSEPPPYYPPPPTSYAEYEAGLAEKDRESRPTLPPRPGNLQSQSVTSLSSTSQRGSPEDGTGGKKSKPTLNERMYRWTNKAAGPINKLTNKLGSEAWWPTTLDKECDKCARILKSFVRDGYYTDDSAYPQPSPGDTVNPGPKPRVQQPPRTPSPYDPSKTKSNRKTIVKIPPEAIARAKGLAIFTTFRSGGPHIGGTGGSGVVLARLPDGSWSPPSGILPNSLSVGLMFGIDIYDCVFVLNTQAAVDTFMSRARFSMGGDLSVVAGPVSAGAVLESDFKSDEAVWSYVKSRGFFAGVQVDGTVIVARPDANGAFYGEKGITAERILRGDVPYHGPGQLAEDGSRMWPEGAARLMAVVRDAEGGAADPRLLAEVGSGPPTPGDNMAWSGSEGRTSTSKAKADK